MPWWQITFSIVYQTVMASKGKLWPENIVRTFTLESISKSKIIKTVQKSIMASSDCLNNILEKQLEKYENNSVDFRLYKKTQKTLTSSDWTLINRRYTSCCQLMNNENLKWNAIRSSVETIQRRTKLDKKRGTNYSMQGTDSRLQCNIFPRTQREKFDLQWRKCDKSIVYLNCNN